MSIILLYPIITVLEAVAVEVIAVVDDVIDVVDVDIGDVDVPDVVDEVDIGDVEVPDVVEGPDVVDVEVPDVVEGPDVVDVEVPDVVDVDEPDVVDVDEPDVVDVDELGVVDDIIVVDASVPAVGFPPNPGGSISVISIITISKRIPNRRTINIVTDTMKVSSLFRNLFISQRAPQNLGFDRALHVTRLSPMKRLFRLNAYFDRFRRLVFCETIISSTTSEPCGRPRAVSS